jgi:Skp family chaperone for outer membrane proteins
VKKIAATSVAALVLSGLMTLAWGQGTTKTAPTALPHKVGLVDVGYIFSKYQKFADLKAEWTTDLKQREADLQRSVEALNSKRAQLKELEKGSAGYAELEKEILQTAFELEGAKKQNQLELVRLETKLYHDVYQEIADTVRLYAEGRRYTLILRYNREDGPTPTEPQQVMQSMQKLVVYYQPQDDITAEILRYLNSNYKPKTTRPAASTKTRTGS